ncbi:MAG: hypothetical protein R6V85_13700 [Polyangia bacterium]
MSALRDALAAVSSDVELFGGNRIGESGRSFSIKKVRRGDEVVAALFDLGGERGNGGLRCDALFLCRAAGELRVTPVFVELKGSHTGHAVRQIKESVRHVCKNTSGSHDRLQAETTANSRHGGRVLGLVVARKGLSLRQVEQKTLCEQGIRLKIVSVPKGKPVVKKCSELHRLLHSGS